jgi:manganese transport protein
MVVIAVCIFFVILFVLMTFLPIIKKKRRRDGFRLHTDAAQLQHFSIPSLDCIAVALDFSNRDEKLIAHALSQGTRSTRFLLLHVVESASARTFGEVSDDYETRKDLQHMQSYVQQLQALGFIVEGQLGYRSRVKEIVRLVQEHNANMLVMGAHHHTGIMDYLYGETVEKVRHQLKIPVLIVS